MFMTQLSRYSSFTSVSGAAQRPRMSQPVVGFAVAAPFSHPTDSVHFGTKRTPNNSIVPYQASPLTDLDSYDSKAYQPRKMGAITVTIHGKNERYFIYSQNLADAIEDDKNDVHEIYQEKDPHISGLIFKSKNGGDWHTLQIRDPDGAAANKDQHLEPQIPYILTLKLLKT